MADSLDKIRWKVNWARERCDALDDLIGRFCEGDTYSVATKIDRKGRYTIRVTDVAPYPVYYVLGVGEVAHQLRSALDHLVFAILRPTACKDQERMQFPLYSKRSRFHANKSRHLPGASRELLKVIESVQPYHRRKWPETWFLGQLQAVNNWDKHRMLIAAAAAIGESNVRIEITGYMTTAQQETFRGGARKNKILARVQIGTTHAGSTIRCYPEISTHPIFAKGMPREIKGKGIRGILTGAGHFIQNEVIPRFERFL